MVTICLGGLIQHNIRGIPSQGGGLRQVAASFLDKGERTFARPQRASPAVGVTRQASRCRVYYWVAISSCARELASALLRAGIFACLRACAPPCLCA